MKKLRPSQLKALSEFLNTVAPTWFSAGVISPLFIKPEVLLRSLILAGIAVLMTFSFLGWSLFLVRRVRL